MWLFSFYFLLYLDKHLSLVRALNSHPRFRFPFAFMHKLSHRLPAASTVWQLLMDHSGRQLFTVHLNQCKVLCTEATAYFILTLVSLHLNTPDNNRRFLPGFMLNFSCFAWNFKREATIIYVYKSSNLVWSNKVSRVTAEGKNKFPSPRFKPHIKAWKWRSKCANLAISQLTSL